MDLELQELTASATEDVLAAEKAHQDAARTHSGAARRRGTSFPDHLPRERVDDPGPQGRSADRNDGGASMSIAKYASR
jgi:hypothetical protein